MKSACVRCRARGRSRVCTMIESHLLADWHVAWLFRDKVVVNMRTRTGYLLPPVVYAFPDGRFITSVNDLAHLFHEGVKMKRPEKQVSDSPLSHAPVDELVSSHPYLAEWLTDATWDDGEKREAPTVTLWAQDGGWRCSLRDRALKRVAWLTAPSLIDLLAMADELLNNPDFRWRNDDDFSPSKGKREPGKK